MDAPVQGKENNAPEEEEAGTDQHVPDPTTNPVPPAKHQSVPTISPHMLVAHHISSSSSAPSIFQDISSWPQACYLIDVACPPAPTAVTSLSHP